MTPPGHFFRVKLPPLYGLPMGRGQFYPKEMSGWSHLPSLCYQLKRSETVKLINEAYRSYPCSYTSSSAVVAGCVTFYVLRTFILEARFEDYLKLGFFESIARTPSVKSLLVIYCAVLCVIPQLVAMSQIEDHRNDLNSCILGIVVGFSISGVLNLIYYSKTYFES